MTNSIPIPPADDITRRDQYGRYLIVPPGGGKPEGYTRVTTVAKTLDPGGGLMSWKASMAAAGIIMRRGLRARWEELINIYNGDPWYASEKGKAACKQLVEECAAVGGADDRRQMGTSLHTITALSDVGRDLKHLTEETEQDLAAYRNGLQTAGVEILPGQVELTVVLDKWRVAGTFDRLVTIPGFALPLIADLKTGADLSYSWQSIAVQLAAYSRADDIYKQGTKPDGSEDVRTPMPQVDQNYGLIIWLNAGEGTLELHLVDLERGWYAFEQSMWARQWRNEHVSTPLAMHNPVQQIAEAGDDLVPLLEASIAAVQAAKSAVAEPVIDVDQPPSIDEPFVTGHEQDQLDLTYTQRVRDWLQERIDLIGQHQLARADLATTWPPDMPTLRSSTEHTPEDLDAIEQVLDNVERQHSLPFGASKPTTDQVGLLLHLFPNSTITTTGDKT